VVAPMTMRIWRIDLCTASRKARLAFSIRCQRSATLYRMRRASFCRRFAILSTAVTGDDRDHGMTREPGLGGRRLTIQQQGGNPAPFQIADDAGVPVIASPGPVINANNPERVSRRTATAPDRAQERILAYRQHQPFCEACRRSTAECQTEVMHDRIQPRRASRRRSQYPFGEALREDLTAA
jgi:hypothetical protein